MTSPGRLCRARPNNPEENSWTSAYPSGCLQFDPTSVKIHVATSSMTHAAQPGEAVLCPPKQSWREQNSMNTHISVSLRMSPGRPDLRQDARGHQLHYPSRPARKGRPCPLKRPWKEQYSIVVQGSLCIDYASIVIGHNMYCMQNITNIYEKNNLYCIIS